MAAALYSMCCQWVNGTRTLMKQMVSRHQTLETIPQCDGKVAVVTGGDKGIGYETVKGLCKAGMSVIIAGRADHESAKETIKKVQDEIPEARVEYMKLDLASIKSIRDFAAKFKEKNVGLNLLVNNAGVMLTPYSLTEDGFELQFGINHVGHFLLTNLFLDLLKRSGTKECYSRVVTVSSTAHVPGTINFDDLQFKKGYSPYDGYSQSKLANVMFTYELQRQLSEEGCYVTANVLHPGAVNTELYRYLPWYMRAPLKLGASLLFKNAEQGAATSIYVALSPELEGVGGKYFDNCQAVDSNAESYNEDKQRKLWEVSCQLAGI